MLGSQFCESLCQDIEALPTPHAAKERKNHIIVTCFMAGTQVFSFGVGTTGEDVIPYTAWNEQDFRSKVGSESSIESGADGDDSTHGSVEELSPEAGPALRCVDFCIAFSQGVNSDRAGPFTFGQATQQEGDKVGGDKAEPRDAAKMHYIGFTKNELESRPKPENNMPQSATGPAVVNNGRAPNLQTITRFVAGKLRTA
jgi:hypothetical protein